MVAATPGLAEIDAEHAMLAGDCDVEGLTAAVAGGGENLNVFWPSVAGRGNARGLSVGVQRRSGGVERYPEGLARPIGCWGHQLERVQLAAREIAPVLRHELEDVSAGRGRGFRDAVQVPLRVKAQSLV